MRAYNQLLVYISLNNSKNKKGKYKYNLKIKNKIIWFIKINAIIKTYH